MSARVRSKSRSRLALDYLRERLLWRDMADAANAEASILADYLAGHIGVLASGEHIPGGAHLSEASGRQFAPGLQKAP